MGKGREGVPLKDSQRLEENASSSFPQILEPLCFYPWQPDGEEVALCLRRINAQDVDSWTWGECIATGLTFYVLLAQHFRSAKSDFVYC